MFTSKTSLSISTDLTRISFVFEVRFLINFICVHPHPGGGKLGSAGSGASTQLIRLLVSMSAYFCLSVFLTMFVCCICFFTYGFYNVVLNVFFLDKLYLETESQIDR